MALPPGFLDDLRARVTVSEIVGRRVSWDSRRSNPARGDFWACCPFHEEKSPSFHVDDRRGFYHCFGCHAKGDAITFLRERENFSFMEAVEELARAAGVAMPAVDPEAAARAQKKRGLTGWTEAAVAFYRSRLASAQGAAARAYLERRGLSAETVARFEIGYAPPGGRTLADHLIKLGATEQQALDAGLTGTSDRGGAPYDRFRDRVMFPIRDAQGACIGFGARGLTPDAKPKYLNSPETALFDKSRVLFNFGPAREAAAKARALVAVEGYMDVVALVEAGIAHAVAPMGTAVTEAHLRGMWRLADEPVMALDGDAAGLSAAMRVIDVALPLLEPGKSLRFALMPPGRDPDDVIRAEGPAAMRALLDAAEPMVALLWRRETEGRVFDSPERAAALDARLRAALAAIADPSVRGHYRAALAERRAALLRPARAPGRPGGGRPWIERGGGPRRVVAPETPLPQTRASVIARAAAEVARREAAVLLILFAHPALAMECCEEVALLEFGHSDLDDVRSALTSALALQEGLATPDDLRSIVAMMLGGDPLEIVCSVAPNKDYVSSDPEVATELLHGALERLRAEAHHLRERTDAEAALAAGPGDAGLIERLARSVALAAQATPGHLTKADNGEAQLSAALRAAIADEIWVKRKRARPDSNR